MAAVVEAAVVVEALLAVSLAAVPAMIAAMAATATAVPLKGEAAMPHHGIWMTKFHFKR
jgi:hypothetical protein